MEEYNSSNEVMQTRILIPYDLIIHVVAPFLFSKKESCIKDKYQSSELIFADKEIYQNLKRYLPKNCIKHQLQFFNKTICPFHEPNRFLLASLFLKSSPSENRFFHPSKNDKIVSKIISQRLLSKKMTVLFEGTPVKVLGECCSGAGIRYEIESDEEIETRTKKEIAEEKAEIAAKLLIDEEEKIKRKGKKGHNKKRKKRNKKRIN